MNPRDEELMERYIYQVIRHLPRDQRSEVGLELQELIGDMLEESDSMEEVLTKLGNPAEFAKKYQDTAHHLIGPEYYDTYLWFLKIVLICTLIPVLAVGVIDGVTEAAASSGSDAVGTGFRIVGYIFANVAGSCIISCMGAFGGVTAVFAVMERQKIKFDLRNEKKWSVNDLGDNFTSRKNIWTPEYLAPVPHKKAIISRGDTIVGIVFIVIFCVLLIFAPHFFSAIFRDNGVITTIPVFNLEHWNIILPVFAVNLVIGLADEVVRLVAGCYCRLVMISSIVTGILQMIISVIILKVFPFWNPDFAVEVKLHLSEQMKGAFKLFENWDGNMVSNGLLAFIFIITFLEIGTTVYKTIRYGTVSGSGDGMTSK
ncbi:MAG: hypothetical protein Q4D16_06375 [Eubacteriales bacterium]|nr:hypothetical protein [Eubacteriales bacterium]